MYEWVKPKCVIPVHGEHRHMIEHIKFAKEMNVPNPVQVENGDIVKLYPGKPEVYDKAPSGRLYVDGNISVVEDAQSIKDRKNLSANGYIEATVLITPKGNIHKRPVLTFRGIPVEDTEELEMDAEAGAEVEMDSEEGDLEVGDIENSEEGDDIESDELEGDYESGMDAVASDDEVEMDMTAASDDDVIAVYKKLTGDDEIEVVVDDEGAYAEDEIDD